MKKPETFREAADFIYDYAHAAWGRLVAADEPVRPFIIALEESGELALIVPAGLGKDETALMLEALARSPRVRCAALCVEAWLATARTKEEKAALERRASLDASVPGVEEVVMISLRGMGEELWAACKIDRKAKRVEKAALEDPRTQMVAGRFFGRQTRH